MEKTLGPQDQNQPPSCFQGINTGFSVSRDTQWPPDYCVNSLESCFFHFCWESSGISRVDIILLVSASPENMHLYPMLYTKGARINCWFDGTFVKASHIHPMLRDSFPRSCITAQWSQCLSGPRADLGAHQPLSCGSCWCVLAWQPCTFFPLAVGWKQRWCCQLSGQPPNPSSTF